MTFLEAAKHLKQGGRIGVQDDHTREQVELIVGSHYELRWKREECDDPERISIDDVLCEDYYTLQPEQDAQPSEEDESCPHGVMLGWCDECECEHGRVA